jgi:hypothetical protein
MSLSVVFDGVTLTDVLSAFCRSGWKQQVPEATVFVAENPFPGSQPYDAGVTITINSVDRFVGVFRRYDYSLWPRALGLVFRGYLVRALEYQNHDDPEHVGGLLLQDLMGSPTATDADVVIAALNRAGINGGLTGSGANIGGTGVTWGSRSLMNGFAYLWRSGTNTNLFVPTAAAGQSALEYIQGWDKVSAVYTGPTDPVGFFRTYETVNGVYRALIGGRPRGSLDVPAFTEGIDIEAGATSSRLYPLANAAYVSGADFGLAGYNPVRNMTFDTAGGITGNVGAFLGQSNNPFQAPGLSITYDFSSPMIEWGTEGESGMIGMSCERVGNALLADLNRETVTIRFRTTRDDLVLPGYTILVRGPGGAPGNLGIGENLWVDEVTIGVAEDASVYQEITATGGGSPDTDTPAPPG